MRTKQYIKEINKYSTQLSKENQEKFDVILLKIRFSNINDHDAEEFSHHCLDLFLRAEKTQAPIEEVLGASDLNAFCNEFIEETQDGYSFVQKLYWHINTLPIIVIMFTGIWEMLIGYLIKIWVKKQILFTVPVTLSMVVDTLIVIVVVTVLIRNSYYFFTVFNGDDKSKDRIATFLLWLGFCALTGLFVVSKLYLTRILFSVNYFVFMGVFGAILFLQHLVENRNI